MQKPAFLIDGAEDIKTEWLAGKNIIGITAGASAPDILVRQVIDRLKELGADSVVELQGREENIVFEVPKELRVEVKEIN